VEHTAVQATMTLASTVSAAVVAAVEVAVTGQDCTEPRAAVALTVIWPPVRGDTGEGRQYPRVRGEDGTTSIYRTVLNAVRAPGVVAGCGGRVALTLTGVGITVFWDYPLAPTEPAAATSVPARAG
jgi:hypothetical protein